MLSIIFCLLKFSLHLKVGIRFIHSRTRNFIPVISAGMNIFPRNEDWSGLNSNSNLRRQIQCYARPHETTIVLLLNFHWMQNSALHTRRSTKSDCLISGRLIFKSLLQERHIQVTEGPSLKSIFPSQESSSTFHHGYCFR